MKVFKEIEDHKNGKKFELVWKSSLGIDSSDEITVFEAYKKSFDTRVSKELCIGVSNLCKKAISEMEKFARKTHQDFKFKLAKKESKKLFLITA